MLRALVSSLIGELCLCLAFPYSTQWYPLSSLCLLYPPHPMFNTAAEILMEKSQSELGCTVEEGCAAAGAAGP